MSDQPAILLLNNLLDAEQSSFILRLGETCPFVGSSEAARQLLLHRLLADAKARHRRLIELILQLRGVPVSPRPASDTAGSHYLSLSFLMPRVIAAQQALIRAYESAGPAGDPAADDLISRHLADLRRDLAALQSPAPTQLPSSS